MQRILYGAVFSSSSFQYVAKHMQRCLLRFATQCSCSINSVVHPHTRHARLITVAKVGVLKLTFHRPAHLRTVTAAVSPETLVVTARSAPLHLFSTTDQAAVCLELQSVRGFCLRYISGCSDRLLNCIKQSQRGAPQSTLTAVKL